MKRPVGPYSPSPAWQTLARPWAVLPIGSTEQHGFHLPLNTDLLEAEYFAEKLALALEAGLLPAIPVLTSMEQGGFRGSLTLGLETGIAMIKDLIDELERQNFTRLIVVNFHGGNHILKPLAKDVNRRNRPLKLLLLNAYEYDTSEEGKAFGRFDIHAGAMETSIMLALHPDLVGDYARAEAPVGIEGAVQDDLAHFGMGSVRPAGVWGNPRLASAEAGRAVIASIERNLLEAAEKRLAWFDEHPVYEGAGPVSVRRMRSEDIPAALELSRLAGWNQDASDWELFLVLDSEGCFAAVHNGRVVGTTTTTNFGGVLGRIAMVLVRPEMRRRGIGKMLVRAAIDRLASCPSVQLDATSEGKPLYDGFGFVEGYRIVRMLRQEGGAPKPAQVPASVRSMKPDDLAAAASLDAEASGADRRALLEKFYEGTREYAFAAREEDGSLSGFCLGKRGSATDRIGPVVARNEETARGLVAAVLGTSSGRPIVIDVPPNHPAWKAWLEANGFRRFKENVRMTLGRDLPEKPELTYAATGASFG